MRALINMTSLKIRIMPTIISSKNTVCLNYLTMNAINVDNLTLEV